MRFIIVERLSPYYGSDDVGRHIWLHPLTGKLDIRVVVSIHLKASFSK